MVSGMTMKQLTGYRNVLFKETPILPVLFRFEHELHFLFGFFFNINFV